MSYFKRHIDAKLLEWKNAPQRKPLLVRGARQVGKSSAVRHLGESFKYFVELNLERQPSLRQLFTDDIDVKRTCTAISALTGTPIKAGETLLFIDEIQACQSAIMSLRYFKEDMPQLHVIAAGSLLEFALEELPSFGVGRIRSLYMYPFSFDEFLCAQGLQSLVDYKRAASPKSPLPEALHQKLAEQLRSFYLIGGMPEAVACWTESNSYAECSHIHNDILDTYQDDFAKYKKRISPVLLRKVLRSVALQAGSKFVYSEADREVRSAIVKEALNLLTLASLVKPVKCTAGNGLPLGAEENEDYVKYLFLDLGLMQTMLHIPAEQVLLSSDIDFVNKGAASEMFAGTELLKYQDCFKKPELFYWQSHAKNANAEVDYLIEAAGNVLPIEVKANTRGNMQSLWLFMRKKQLVYGVRTSLENFGQFVYHDNMCDEDRQIDVLPLYAISSL